MPRKKKAESNLPTVFRDSSEHDGFGWHFQKSEWCAGTEEKNLFTGDYTLSGFEQTVIVERKLSSAEVAKNFFEDRFEDELTRLDAFPFPFVVCEFTLSSLNSFPYGSGIPKSEWAKLKVSGRLLMKRLNDFHIAHPRVHWVFAGAAAKEFVRSLFKRVVEAGPQQ